MEEGREGRGERGEGRGERGEEGRGERGEGRERLLFLILVGAAVGCLTGDASRSEMDS